MLALGKLPGTNLAGRLSVMDDLPLDFTEYVSQRLGLSGEETKRLLVAWLRSYEPVTRRPILPLTRARDAHRDDEVGTLLREAG
jgi:hypothetical protein